MAQTRANILTIEKIPVLERIPILAFDYFDKYLEGRRELWEKSKQQLLIDSVNFASNTIIGANVINDIPEKRKTLIEEFKTLFRVAMLSNRMQEWCDLTLKLGEEALIAKNETHVEYYSLFNEVCHAARSYIVACLKKHDPLKFQAYINQLLEELAVVEANIQNIGLSGQVITPLIKSRNQFLLKLTYLEHAESIFKASDYKLLGNLEWPSDHSHFSLAAKTNPNIPSRLQSEEFSLYYEHRMCTGKSTDLPFHLYEKQVINTYLAAHPPAAEQPAQALAAVKPNENQAGVAAPASVEAASSTAASAPSKTKKPVNPLLTAIITLDTRVPVNFIESYVAGREKNAWHSYLQQARDWLRSWINYFIQYGGYSQWEDTPGKRRASCETYITKLGDPSVKRTIKHWTDIIYDLGVVAQTAQSEMQSKQISNQYSFKFSYGFILFHAIRSYLVKQLKAQYADNLAAVITEMENSLANTEAEIQKLRTEGKTVSSPLNTRNRQLLSLVFMEHPAATLKADSFGLIDGSLTESSKIFQHVAPSNINVPLYLQPEFFSIYYEVVVKPDNKFLSKNDTPFEEYQKNPAKYSVEHFMETANEPPTYLGTTLSLMSAFGAQASSYMPAILGGAQSPAADLELIDDFVDLGTRGSKQRVIRVSSQKDTDIVEREEDKLTF